MGTSEESGDDGRAAPMAARASAAYGSGLGTMVRDNASAYGFSVAITGSFGVVSGTQGSAGVVDAILFALGAGLAFVVVELTVSRWFRNATNTDPSTVIMVSTVVNVVSIVATVGVSAGLALLPSVAAWPVTGWGATTVYLLAGGLDVVVARRVVARSARMPDT